MLAAPAFAAEPGRESSPRWWKGNLHTHSLWSDGDDYSEMIAGWYQQHGCQFIGTRKGFDSKNEPVRAPNGKALRVTHNTISH